MERETQACRELSSDQKMAEIYSFVYSEKDESLFSKTKLLDTGLAVNIVVNHNEEGFFLDYRLDLHNPVVVANYWLDSVGSAEHRLVAKNFEHFAKILDL